MNSGNQNEPKSQQPARVEQDNPSKNPKARILNSHGGQLTPVGTGPLQTSCGFSLVIGLQTPVLGKP